MASDAQASKKSNRSGRNVPPQPAQPTGIGSAGNSYYAQQARTQTQGSTAGGYSAGGTAPRVNSSGPAHGVATGRNASNRVNDGAASQQQPPTHNGGGGGYWQPQNVQKYNEPVNGSMYVDKSYNYGPLGDLDTLVVENPYAQSGNYPPAPRRN